MDDLDRLKNQANGRAALLLEQSVELRRFRHAYPHYEARLKEIASDAPDDIREALEHVVAQFSQAENDDDPEIIRFFNLTAAEGRLAAWLMTGGNLSEYASEVGVTRNTARNQLQSVFQKVQVNRQAELVSVLLETSRKLTP